jgi:hypothetical protein
VTLTDNNATAVVNTGSQAGMNFWSVDGNGLSGQNQLQQQWFWYRVGNSVPQSINTMSGPTNTLVGLNNLTTTYFNSTYNFGISISYQLSGTGLGNSDIMEGIQIQNFSSATNNISFFQYSHFTLLGQNSGNTIMAGNTGAQQQNGQTAIAESIITPPASAFEATNYGITLPKLNSVPGLTLSDTNPNDTQTASGDVTWAFEWDLSVAPGAVVDISKDKLLSISNVPEPSVLGLAGLAVLALRRRLTVKKA